MEYKVSIALLHTQLASGTLTCVQHVQQYLTNIQANTHLNAFLEVFEAEALERAAYLDELWQQGTHLPLHGVVVGLKDVISYQGHKLSAASKILENFTAVYSATAVERLLQAGAIIIGRQNCDEFAMGGSNENSAFGKVLNALDNNRVPGGSSGGSAVSVQANLCQISLGTDTGGSVRQPADFCGIVGVKPTYGRISRHGLLAYASSFDQIGIFSHTVQDAALVLETIAGADNFDSTALPSAVPPYSQYLHDTQLQAKRFAYFKQSFEHPSLDTHIKQQFEQLFNDLRRQGYTVEAVDFPLLPYVVPTYYVLTTAEASSNLSRYDGVKFGYVHTQAIQSLDEFYKQNRSNGFGKEVKRRIMLGNFVLSAGYFDAYYTKAQQVRQLLHTQTQAIFEQFDAIISPTVPTPAFPFGEKSASPIDMFLADIFTVHANLVGIPGISVPKYTHISGMPFGIQVFTNKEKEAELLATAAFFEQL